MPSYKLKSLWVNFTGDMKRIEKLFFACAVHIHAPLGLFPVCMMHFKTKKDVKFAIFLLSFAWALQQRSANELPVTAPPRWSYVSLLFVCLSVCLFVCL